jgi:hypothetical protein
VTDGAVKKYLSFGFLPDTRLASAYLHELFQSVEGTSAGTQ